MGERLRTSSTTFGLSASGFGPILCQSTIRWHRLGRGQPIRRSSSPDQSAHRASRWSIKTSSTGSSLFATGGARMRDPPQIKRAGSQAHC